MSFTRGDLIAKVAADLNIDLDEAEKAVRLMFEEIGDALKDGRRVVFRGFGVFDTLNRPAHVGRNPKTGEAVDIPDRRLPRFRCGKSLFEKINRDKKRGIRNS